MPGVRYNYKSLDQLYMTDDYGPKDHDSLGGALSANINEIDGSRQSLFWRRTLNFVRNILFYAGRHYLDDILLNRLARTTNDDLSLVREATRNIPRPTNDFLGRYVETNVALVTENRPRPRVTPKSDNAEDLQSANLSELTLEYLWEALDMPEKHRSIARMVLLCGVCWMEICYDELMPRRLTVPETVPERATITPEGASPVKTPVERQVPLFQEGKPVYKSQIERGDVTARIVSPFEMRLPSIHYWNDESMGWVMREWFMPKSSFTDKIGTDLTSKNGFGKRDGWHFDRIEGSSNTGNLQDLPIWWWSRLSQLVEGAGPTFYAGTPEIWKDHILFRIFDRKPNKKWPQGRTVLVAGDQVIYDSPRDRGARAYDARWPERWHPYTRFTWEDVPGNVYGRALVTKLLPKVKRVNAIDTTLIMYRRTSPIACWISPKGAAPVEDFFSGRPGSVWEYDPRRTASAKPEPIFPPPYPKELLEERQQQIAEMESISGVEEILRGQRPTGVNCWVKESELTNGNGIPIKVENINIGDNHMSMEGEGPIGTCHERKYSGNVITIKSWGNLPVIVTPNHEFPVIERLSRNRFSPVKRKKASEINKGDRLLSGYIRPRDGGEKLNIAEFGGVFKPNNDENHGSTKITNQQAEEIRIRVTLGETQRSLAREFGVSEACVSRLINRKTFKYSFKSKGTPLPLYVELTEDILWLFGIYLAEGYCSAGVHWSLHESETNIANEIKRIVKENFGLDTYIRPLTDSRKGMTVSVHNNALSRFFETILKTGSHEKEIHSCIFRSSVSLIPLVSGWMDGDGDKNNNSIRGQTVSDSLASQIRSILLDERVYVTINKFIPHSSSFENFSDTYKLTVSSLDAIRIAEKSLTYSPNLFYDSKGRGRRGKWIDDFYASGVYQISSKDYNDAVYNVTMDERTGCDNSVNSYGVFTYQSASMVSILRKQALASRTAALQSWDESLQQEGSALLQEVIKHVGEDPRYAERIRILAREKESRFTVDKFSGRNLSDNVQVRVDTASMSLVSKEAREAKVLEFLQYAPALASLPLSLRQAVVEELGLKAGLTPQGADVDRAKRMISWIKQEAYDRVVPYPEDDPMVFHEILVNFMKSEGFYDLNNIQQQTIIVLIDQYRDIVEAQQKQALELQMRMAALGMNKGQGQGGGQVQ